MEQVLVTIQITNELGTFTSGQIPFERERLGIYRAALRRKEFDVLEVVLNNGAFGYFPRHWLEKSMIFLSVALPPTPPPTIPPVESLEETPKVIQPKPGSTKSKNGVGMKPEYRQPKKLKESP